MTKKEIRTQMLAERSKLSSDDVSSLSLQISVNFFNFLKDLNSKTIHSFLPILERKEVDAWPIINGLLEHYKDVSMVSSRVNYESQELEHVPFNSTSVFHTDQWGISVPTTDRVTPEKDIDLIITPLLGFNQQGHRVGYGKGFYDRFFKKCRPDAKKVGVSFFSEAFIIDDLNEFDIALDYCITPSKIFQFEQQ